MDLTPPETKNLGMMISQVLTVLNYYSFVGDSAGFVKKIVTTISGIASISKKSLKLTS